MQHNEIVKKFGWQPSFMGEIDHRNVASPYIRLIDFKHSKNGDFVCFYDIRFAQPNKESISAVILHSLEHCLIFGFRKYLPNQFISIGPMGCQTGFYLVLLDMISSEKVASVLKSSLEDILNFSDVPYRSLQDCGQMKNHDLVVTQEFSKKILEQKEKWFQIEKVNGC